MSLMKLIDLKKEYVEGKDVKTQALKGINLEFEEGDFAVISGPSGSGKTTLINLMGGLDSPTSGQVYLKDRNISEMKEDKLKSMFCAAYKKFFDAL